MSFSKGRIGEDFAKGVLESCGIKCSKNDDYEKRYDYDLECKVGRKYFTIEGKYDYKAEETGNIAIEHHNTKVDRPSGITATKADLWVYVLGTGDKLNAWVVKSQSLKSFLEEVPPFKEVVYGGDNNAALYIYKKEDILGPLFIRMDDLEEDGLKALIKGLL